MKNLITTESNIIESIKKLQEIGLVAAFNNTQIINDLMSIKINGSKESIEIFFPNEEFNCFDVQTTQDVYENIESFLVSIESFDSFDQCLIYIKSNFVWTKGSLIGLA